MKPSYLKTSYMSQLRLCFFVLAKIMQQYYKWIDANGSSPPPKGAKRLDRISLMELALKIQTRRHTTQNESQHPETNSHKQSSTYLKVSAE
jgi:hypothetical protein